MNEVILGYGEWLGHVFLNEMVKFRTSSSDAWRTGYIGAKSHTRKGYYYVWPIKHKDRAAGFTGYYKFGSQIKRFGRDDSFSGKLSRAVKPVKDAAGKFLYYRYITLPAAGADVVLSGGSKDKLKAMPISKAFSRSASGKQLVDSFYTFVFRNSDVLMEIFNIDFDQLVLFTRTVLAIARRESQDGKSFRYTIKQDVAPMLAKALKAVKGTYKASKKAGKLVYVEPQMSKGQTQIKYASLYKRPNATISKLKQRFDIESEDDLINEFGLLSTMAHLDAGYKTAMNSGYSEKLKGHIRGAVAVPEKQKLFKSTGNAALDAALVYYNSGKIIKDAKNYIPCIGGGCEGIKGQPSTYSYVGEISNLLNTEYTDSKVRNKIKSRLRRTGSQKQPAQTRKTSGNR